MAGSVPLSAPRALGALFGHGDPLAIEIVGALRLPRAMAAFACGGLLALSGALLQVLLRNPLADPYVLGVSGGAAVGALSAMLAGAALWAVDLAAWCGAALAMAAVLGLSLRSGDWNLFRLLLTGVVIAAAAGAFIALVLALAPAAEVKGMLFWLMGDLSRAHSPWGAVLLLAAAVLAGALLGPGFDALALGALKARTLGVAVLPLQLAAFLGASALTGAALTLGGMIGFVGLVTPHALRLLGITRHRCLMPASALLGGAFLTAADTLARSVAAPQQLPVGALTAAIGVPLFLFLLSRR